MRQTNAEVDTVIVTAENSSNAIGLEQGVTKLRLVSTPTGFAVGHGSRCSHGCPTPSAGRPSLRGAGGPAGGLASALNI